VLGLFSVSGGVKLIHPDALKLIHPAAS